MPKSPFWWSLWLYDAPRCPRTKSRTGMPMAKAPAQASHEGYGHAHERSLPNKMPSTTWLDLQAWSFTTETYTGTNCKPLASRFLYNFPAKHSHWGLHQQLCTQVRTKPTPSSNIILSPHGFCWNHLTFHGSWALSTVVTADKTSTGFVEAIS